MNRREFIRDVLLWSAGLTVALPRFTIPEVIASPPSPLLAVDRGTDYIKLLDRVLASLGGMKNFVRPGDRVVIKPNIGWDRAEQFAANTNPKIVRALVEQALAAGASRVQVFDRTCNEKRRCYKNSGIEDALKSMNNRNVSIEHIDDRKFVPVEIKRGKSLSRMDIYKDALEADCYINVPVAKHHGLSRLTLGLKNSMGVIGGNRGMMHFDLGQKLADLATVIQPALTVIDATKILVENGPQGGRLEDVQQTDTIIACVDPVAADAYATTLFGLQPEAIESTVAAYKLGLGEMHIERMKILTATV
ncbi:MAG: DUF362 domain-containing protein [Desulfobulbaceae bacterium]|nr:DUF362 domain-containing protein [Desulfobulbaceae bacterium]